MTFLDGRVNRFHESGLTSPDLESSGLAYQVSTPLLARIPRIRLLEYNLASSKGTDARGFIGERKES
jgi:hypothetical protein